MYWVRVLEESGLCRAIGAVISAAVVLGAAGHGLGALVRLLF
ncbi:hypothetical protein [Cohnella boryungensis]|uniref:Uncharacterized protein n=1 Tax=Cohnella boryungensis TaxID=768479 RepID=A0ABV8SG13_9BACL